MSEDTLIINWTREECVSHMKMYSTPLLQSMLNNKLNLKKSLPNTEFYDLIRQEIARRINI